MSKIPPLLPAMKSVTSTQIATETPDVAATNQVNARDVDGVEQASTTNAQLTGARDSAPVTARGPVYLTTNTDDPFARENGVSSLPRADFTLDARGRPIGLTGPQVAVADDTVIYRPVNGRYEAYATNPWVAAKPSRKGNFVFEGEERFPLHQIVRDAAGRPVLDAEGLQQWVPRSSFAGQSIAFDATNTARNEVEKWSGRSLPWGIDGQLPVNAHAFVGFNAFFSPAARALFFGVIPYRLPGEADIKMFEMSSSWEVGVHEAGHALHNELKPNRGLIDQGYREWGESFGDQLGMWATLQDPQRAKQLLVETRGDLRKTNSVTAIGEVYASLVGEGTGIRDAYQGKTVSSTTDEYHDRSEVLTGAAYKIFLRIYKDVVDSQHLRPQDAVRQAATIMGQFLTLTADFTPENTMTMEDVAKGYLKVDKEFFGGKYQAILVNEFISREIFRPAPAAGQGGLSSLDEWLAHEAAIPALTLGGAKDDAAAAQLVTENLEALGIGHQFGLTLQSRTKDAYGRDIVRVELTYGCGPDAQPIANHGVLVFRPDGSLADYQAVMPRGLSDDEAVHLLEEARAAGLPEAGKVGFVKDENGQWTVQVITPTTDEGDNALNAYVEVRDLASPQGRRVEYSYNREDRLQYYQRFQGMLPSGAQVFTGDVA